MLSKITNYLRTSVEELKKVTWPTRKETMSHTALVIAVSIVMAIFLGLVDYGLTWLVQRFF